MYNLMIRIFKLVRSYFVNTSLHGFRFIAQKGRHWSERVLWIILCALAWIGSGVLFNASWDAYQNNAVSFVVETAYLRANTSFPSLSVCEDENLSPLYEVANDIFGSDHDCNLDEILRELTYFKGSAYYTKEFCYSGELNCPSGDYFKLVNKVRSTCEDLILTCSWNGEPFDCCKHFVKTETELGPCYTFGSRFERELQKRGDSNYINTVANRQFTLPFLRIELNGTSKIYMHSEADVPYLNTLTADILIPTLNTIKTYYITVTDIENPPEVRDLSIKQRKCRFEDENYLQSADYYSYSACVVDCRRSAQLKSCDCTSHFMPKSQTNEHCDLQGILCLNTNYGNLSVQKTKWGEKEGLICDCLPGCSDPEYNVVTAETVLLESETNVSIVEIKLEKCATERYKRNVVRGQLDLVVSMGSAAGLFVGASLLSFVEIFYFFLFRSPTDEDEQSDDEESDAPESINNFQNQSISNKGMPFIW